MNKKRNVAGFLAIAIMLSAIFTVLPQMASEVYAASPDIQVEQGQEFYLGDYFNYLWRGNNLVTASMVKSSYTSSKPSVASVDKKGYFVTRETGFTTVTVKYKGQKEKMKIEVVPAGTFVKEEAAIRLEERAGELAKKILSSISTKNGFEITKLLRDYKKANAGSISYISEDGFLQEKNTAEGALTKYVRTEKLVVPKAGRYNTLYRMLGEFCDKNWPPEIKSVVSAKNNKITAKLKKKFTANHLLALYISSLDSASDGNDKLKKTSKKAYGSVQIFDLNAFKTYDYGRSYKRYYGVITYKKDSNIVTIQPYTDKSESFSYVKKGKKTKLVKGHKYRLGDSSKGPTFTLK